MKPTDADKHRDDRSDEARGGESPCLAHLLCLECGAVLDGGSHREGCSLADETSAPEPGAARARPRSEA